MPIVIRTGMLEVILGGVSVINPSAIERFGIGNIFGSDWDVIRTGILEAVFTFCFNSGLTCGQNLNTLSSPLYLESLESEKICFDNDTEKTNDYFHDFYFRYPLRMVYSCYRSFSLFHHSYQRYMFT